MRTFFCVAMVFGLIGCGSSAGEDGSSLTPEQKAAWERAKRSHKNGDLYVYCMVGTSKPEWQAVTFSPFRAASKMYAIDPSAVIGTPLDKDENPAIVRSAWNAAEHLSKTNSKIAYAAVIDLFGSESPRIIGWLEGGRRIKAPPQKVVDSMSSHLRQVHRSIGD